MNSQFEALIAERETLNETIGDHQTALRRLLYRRNQLDIELRRARLAEYGLIENERRRFTKEAITFAPPQFGRALGKQVVIGYVNSDGYVVINDYEDGYVAKLTPECVQAMERV